MLKPGDFSAVIFDMDGLVLDTESTYRLAWQRAALAMGHELSEPFFTALSGLPAPEVERKLMN
ncbi:MAG: HAD family phosphatase, partial [Gammaproteobacteria bacterium]